MEKNTKHPGGRPSESVIEIEDDPEYIRAFTKTGRPKKRKPAKVLRNLLSDLYIEWCLENSEKLFPDDAIDA